MVFLSDNVDKVDLMTFNKFDDDVNEVDDLGLKRHFSLVFLALLQLFLFEYSMLLFNPDGQRSGGPIYFTSLISSLCQKLYETLLLLLYLLA